MTCSSSVLPKRIARIVAAQFMYHMQITECKTFSDADVDEFVKTFVVDRMDTKFFKRLLADFLKPSKVEDILNEALNDGKSISNSPPVEISIIKTALIEMIYEKTDIPVVINEYIEIAKDFLDERSAKFINALLDKISKRIKTGCQEAV